MTMNNTNIEKDEDMLKQIQKTLKQYENKTVTVKQYCQFSTKVLTIKNIQDLLYSSYQELQARSKKNQQGNSRVLAVFLIFPNINYNQYRVIRDQTNANLMIDAGKKIIGTISYAWDYYSRLIKNKRENKKTNEIQSNTLISARMRLNKMLQEMKQNKYHWQNFTKENLTNKHFEEKQIKEEQIQIDLLKNIIRTQIQKMEKKKKQIPENIVQNIKQRQIQNAEQIDFGYLQSQGKKKNINKLINVGGYFRKKKKSRNKKNLASDTLTKCQEQRQSSNIVLRFTSKYSK